MSKYDVNIKRFVLQLLPTFLRRPLLAAFAYAAVTPLNRLQMRFSMFREDANYRLTHNGQVCYLRAALNDMFDPIERRIGISEAPDGSNSAVVYKREENRGPLLPMRGQPGGIRINRRGYGGASGYDFWINIPYALRGEVSPDRLKALVNAYKLASKQFEINYV